MATPHRGKLALQGEIQQLRERIAELERERAQNSPTFSKERLDLALEAAGLGTWEVASESGVVTASGRTSAMFGFDNARPQVEGWVARLHPDDRERVRGEIRHAIAGASQYETEYRVLGQDGAIRWVFAKAIPVLDGESHSICLVGVAQDVTARKQVEEQNRKLLAAVQEEKDKLSAVIASISDEVWYADTQKRFTLANPSALGEFGLAGADEIEIDEFAASLEMLRADGSPRPVQESPAVRALNGELVKGEEEIIRMPGTGQLRYRQVSSSPVKDASGKTTGSVSVVRDVTDRKRAEQALRESEERLRMTLDAAQIGTFEFHPQTGKLFWDDHNKRIWGLRPGDEWAYHEAIQRVHPEDREAVKRTVTASLEPDSDGFFDSEYRIVLPDGAVHWTLAKGRVYFEGEGENRRAARMVGIQLDTTDRKRTEQALAADLAALTRMHALSTSLLETDELEPLLQEIMDAAMAIMSADRGTLQLIEGDSLRIVAHHGHQLPFLEFLASAEDRTFICEEALRRGERVVVEDVERSPLFTGTASLPVFREAGVRAVQSTPVLSRSGALLGVLTTQGAVPYLPNEHDLWRIDLLVRQAADLIEHIRSRAELRMLAQFAEQNPSPVLCVAPGGGLNYANAAARSWLASMGVSEGQLPAVARTLVERVSREGRVMEEEFGSEHGRTFWFTAAQPPGVGCVNLYGRDITERKQAEERLFETHQRLQALMEALPIGVSFSDDATCERITGNPAVLAQFEVGSGDNLSASAPELAAPGRKVRFFQDGREIGDAELPMQRAVRYNSVIPPVELEVRLPSGRLWFADASGAPVRDRQGNVVGGVAVTVDITERKRSEERLRHAQKLESIGVLAGGIAHDFNNLLTAILGNASLLHLDATAGSAERFQAIIEASEKAAALTRQLLAYAGKGRFQIIDFDITRLVRSSADLIRVSIPKSVDLRLDVPRNLPAVRGDSSQIEQVIMNLVINAAEATEGRGDGRVSVSVGIRDFDAALAGQIGSGMAPGRYVSITVRDNGCGLDEQTKEKIFDPFFTTKFTGRGLGLAAVQGILRAHKGTITVDSTPGHGSTFTVYLPCGEGEAAASSGEDTMKPGSRAATVLMVDDEELVCALTKGILEKLGHRVLLAQNGCQALEILGNHAEIDLVVLDIIMPVMGGVEAFSEMRKKWPDLAVLVASGYSRYEAPSLGIPDDLPFIEKPYTVQTLATAVEKALQPRLPVLES